MIIESLIIQSISTTVAARRWPRLLYIYACVYALPAAHLLLFADATGFVYHATAALFDAMIVTFLLSHSSRLTTQLATINVAAITINAVGWVLYELGASPNYYETMICTMLYAQFIRMIWISDHDHRELDKLDNWGGVVHWIADSRDSSDIESDKCKTQTR